MNLKVGDYLVNRTLPYIVKIFSITHATIQITYKSYLVNSGFTIEDIDKLYYKFEPGMILYSHSGNCKFSYPGKIGYYKVNEHIDYVYNEIYVFESKNYKKLSIFLGEEIAGNCQEDYQRYYKMKAFW